MFIYGLNQIPTPLKKLDVCVIWILQIVSLWIFCKIEELVLPNKHWHSHTSIVFHFVLHVTQNQLVIFVPPVYIN
jgi:hypothetical protein